MARSIGNLAIIISGNAGPLTAEIGKAKSHLMQFQNQANRILTNRAVSGAGLLTRPGGVLSGMPLGVGARNQFSSAVGLRYSSIGRFAQSAFIKGFGGGFVGGIIAVFGYDFVQRISALAGTAGSAAAHFLSDSLQKGIDLSRLEVSLKFLAENGSRATQWLQQMIELSSASGYDLNNLGAAFQTIAGQTTDLEEVPKIMRAITEIGTGLGADAARMNRLALAIGQVAAAGRFEGQEILQLTETIPIKHFADTAGISIGEFRKRMKEGTLSVEILWQTLNRLALAPGGKFTGRLAEQAKTAVGQVMQLNQSIFLLKAGIGKGLLEELKNQGVLSALQQGVQFIAAHQGEILGFIQSAVDLLRRSAIATARIAGATYDVWLYLKDIVKYIAIALSAMPPFATAAKVALDALNELSGRGPLLSGGHAEEWAKAVADSFNREFVPRVQKAMDLINVPPTLPADLRKMADGFRDAMQEGVTPLDKFERQIRMITETEKFYADQIRRVKDDWWLNWRNRRQLERAETDASEFAKLAEFGRAQAVLELARSTEKDMERAINELPRAMEAGSVDAASAINKSLYGNQDTMEDKFEKAFKRAERQRDDALKEQAAARKALEKLNLQTKGL